ncbi:NUDIX domain-containing protein [Parafrankia sp. FMc2]|uniref:NUDIX domain-containing protein n=1 Tax=Parafrankia sp. FMc2 TaxID=3233196 RepID=UPI0034D770AC
MPPERAFLTADVAALAVRDGVTHVLVIRRRWAPSEGQWALPGGHVDPGETVAAAAVRELSEETGLTVPVISLTPVGAYSAPGRDPRGRYVTVAFLLWLPDTIGPAAADDATDARWIPVHTATGLAFDHDRILTDALNSADVHIR